MLYALRHFIIYGVTGLLLEILWTGVSSGLRGDLNMKCTTYLWMFFIYGCGIFLEPIHALIRPLFWAVRGLIWAALIFSLEYGCGMALKLSIGKCPWDYTGEGALSVRGFIRLDFLPAWFAVGLLFERLHDLLIFMKV